MDVISEIKETVPRKRRSAACLTFWFPKESQENTFHFPCSQRVTVCSSHPQSPRPTIVSLDILSLPGFAPFHFLQDIILCLLFMIDLPGDMIGKIVVEVAETQGSDDGHASQRDGRIVDICIRCRKSVTYGVIYHLQDRRSHAGNRHEGFPTGTWHGGQQGGNGGCRKASSFDGWNHFCLKLTGQLICVDGNEN
jgi:hypothetical protein